MVKRGKESHTKLTSIFDVAEQRTDFGIAGIVGTAHVYNSLWSCDYLWFSNDFNWFHIPVRIENLGNEEKDAFHTFTFVMDSVLGDKDRYLNPFFICSDNEARMKAAFDGKCCEDERQNVAGRVGCVEHALSTCINDVFDKDAQDDLSIFIYQIYMIETPTITKGQVWRRICL